jgi:hypothetical protein
MWYSLKTRYQLVECKSLQRVCVTHLPLPLAEACHGLYAVVIFMLPSWRVALKPLRCFSEVQDSLHCLGPCSTVNLTSSFFSWSPQLC